MDPVDIERYLDRIGLPPAVPSDLDGLALLQHAHLAHVPFENLDIALGDGVPHDRTRSLSKILHGRGGWCFEVNGAFGLLLAGLGFEVRLLGAAVLLDGPNRIIEHLALEVSGGVGGLDPHLVDVGFGDAFDVPLALNRAGPQPGGHADFELLASPDGTTLAEIVDGVPEARYRFKRVAHDFDDFEPIARSMQIDPDKHWSSKPFATRLLDVDSFDRVTLTHDRVKLRRDGIVTERPVEPDDWAAALDDWFGIEIGGA